MLFPLVAVAALVGPAQEPLTLERIMADPDWIGTSPEQPYWGDDSRTVFYSRKRVGEELRDLWRVDAAEGDPQLVAPEERPAVSTPGGDWSSDHAHYVWERAGDLFLRAAGSSAIRQISRTAARESNPRFAADDRAIFFERDGELFAFDLATGLTWQPFELLSEDDPDEEEEDLDYLERKHLRLYAKLAEREADEEARDAQAESLRAADPSRAPEPWYLGDGVEVAQRSLSPNGRWLIVATRPEESDSGERGTMPNYVTESGYVETRSVRRRVGREGPSGHELLLLDLETRARHELDLAALPGIDSDPLAEVRAEALEWHVERGAKREEIEEELKAPEVRPVQLVRSEWSAAGDAVLLRIDSNDNKDRWLATLALSTGELHVQHRLTDSAWINWRFNDFGWLPDGRTFWFESEEDGWGHLYVQEVGADVARQLTRGPFTARGAVLDRAGEHLYYYANPDHPAVYEIYRVGVRTGAIEPLTSLGGSNEFRLSPDGTRLLLLHSEVDRPQELWAQEARPGAPARRLTHTITEEFQAIPWIRPEFVAIPSTHVERPIWARLYRPPHFDPAQAWPAVVFVHGAGYLQDAHAGWSYYFHEFMFHTLLAQRGYVVVGIDFRGSAGYGRDWRTAIYRQVGHPETEDLQDTVDWLAREHAVDSSRVGVYGGSYGGFLTFMSMFREPELFAAGAALRPVADWAHYNHGYTSNLLNTPEVDPVAYERSSPIEFAEGLSKPLLICAGMQDDNVFFQDTVLLVQRLIELKKQDFETAFYPLEPHSFVEPESWLDEYRRIFKLFERYLKP